MARLSPRPAPDGHEPRTSAIAPEAGRDVPWEGRARDDEHGFAPLALVPFEPIMRPTFHGFPEDAQCLEDCDDFTPGPDLLVAPVVEPGQSDRRVWLPALPGGGACLAAVACVNSA
jgi:hypothetical protein